MRKAILMMLLAVVSSSAAAKWVEIDDSDDATFYVDPATIRKAGNIVKMWHIFDLKKADTVNGKHYMSMKGQGEYDCKEERWRIIYSNSYSEHMGTGSTVYNFSRSVKWEPVAPETMVVSLWEFACKKR